MLPALPEITLVADAPASPAFPAITDATVGAGLVPTVDGRELHAFLQNRDHFATWIRDRIRQYGFAEGIDFVTFSEVSEKGGRPSAEYALTIDMAKEVSMVERNDQGKRARLYFIDCERRAKANPFPIPQTLPEALRLAADLAEQVASQKVAIAEFAALVAGFWLLG